MDALTTILPDLEATRIAHTQLIDARGLISSEKNWCQNELVHESPDPGVMNTVQYCARGALGVAAGINVHGYDAAGEIIQLPADSLLDLAARDLCSDVPEGVFSYWHGHHVEVNNIKEHADVLMVFDGAINLAEKRLGELLES